MVAPGDELARAKLRRAFKVAAPPPRAAEANAANAANADEPLHGLRAFLQRRREQLLPVCAPPVELPSADVLATPHGPLWRRELRYPLGTRHGEVPLAGVLQLADGRLAELARVESLRTATPHACLFLDTETTGLMGGAGTMVFAYGLGFVRGDELVLEQLFLRDFGEEPAMLWHVAERLHEFPVPVTYVGKSFDRHRIAARLAVHRMAAPVLTEGHVDLYHVVRRRHGKQWPDARLRTAERRLLGLERHDDLPGSEAPAAFLQWIRDRTGPVDRVLEHNRLDVLSLVALLSVLGA